jgi:PAS domain S-box-containing protein
MRFGPRGGATATFALSLLAIWGAVEKLGPFAHPTLSEALLQLGMFMGATAVTSLALAAVVAERAQSERLTRDSEARTRAIVDTAVDGIITIDEQRIIQDFNPAAERLFGYQAEEVIGRNIKLLMPPPYHDEHDTYVANYLRTGVKKIIGSGREVVGRRKDGSTFPMELAVSEVSLGQRRMFTGIIRDITERKRLEQQLRQRVEDLAEADRRKNEFLGMLSHELRNPLAPIQSALQLIRMANSDPAALEWPRAVAERQVGVLARLVDGLLDASRISQGKIELCKQEVDLATVVGHAVETAQPLCAARRHELVVSLPPEPVIVHADSMRLAQVITNLLTNAAKYTEPGGRIWLTVELENDKMTRWQDDKVTGVPPVSPCCPVSPSPCPLVRISVRDTGIGIPADLMPLIFDLFTQGERPLDRSQGGLGVGLTLVHKLVELHGGQIQAFSAGAGQGSEFVVHLPILVERPRPERPLKKEDKKPAVAAAQRRVLIVEDNVDAAEILAAYLRMGGHDVRVALNGPAALQAATAFRPEVVLLDIGLPGMTGYEVARRLRQSPELETALLVALTGYAQSEDRHRASEAGFDHHLAKPVDPGTLKTLLAQPWRRQTARRRS